VDDLLQQHLGEQVVTYRRWKELHDELAQLRATLGEPPIKVRTISCLEPLMFGRQIDDCAQVLYGVRPDRIQRKAIANELNRREREWRERQAQPKQVA
jgi:hypothetical protein